jgi:hypothetical protein
MLIQISYQKDTYKDNSNLLRQNNVRYNNLSVAQIAFYGALAEWLGTGLQNLVHGFESRTRLQLTN